MSVPTVFSTVRCHSRLHLPASLSTVRWLPNHEDNSNCRQWPTPTVAATTLTPNSASNLQYRLFAFSADSTKKTKRKGVGPGTAQAGRVVLYEQGGKGNKAGKVQMCIGCGTQIISGGVGMKGGEEAAQYTAMAAKIKTQEKKSRYADVSDGGKLCQRCKALREADGDDGGSGNIWKAYDVLRDVEPKVFMDQLKFVVQRRKFGIALIVLDVTDSEHSQVTRIRDAIGKAPLVGVWNKVDLLPRFNRMDQRAMERKLGIRLLNSFAVSARTGYGLVELAEHILTNVGGRDVFVIGSANVGKSTMVKNLSKLIAMGVWFKDRGKKRKGQVSSLQVTGSHLPGTTLHAIRIPCFPSKGHALWDTPGIINSRAVQYRIFPSHLMEPMTRAQRIEVPTKENGRTVSVYAGSTLLIESTWMGHDNEDDEPGIRGDDAGSGEEECVLARIDMLEVQGAKQGRRSVGVSAYLHPALRIRVVSTDEAPDMANIPKAHIERIKEKIQRATGQHETGLHDEYALPLLAYKAPQRPEGVFQTGAEDQSANGVHFLDVVFASLGWIALTCSDSFSYVPRCVQGSVFSKRRSIYPAKLRPEEANYCQEGQLDWDRLEFDDSEIKDRFMEAVRTGRRMAGRSTFDRKGSSGKFGDKIFHNDDDEWY